MTNDGKSRSQQLLQILVNVPVKEIVQLYIGDEVQCGASFERIERFPAGH